MEYPFDATTHKLMALSTHPFSGFRLESILYVEEFIIKVLNGGVVMTRRGVQRSENL